MLHENKRNLLQVEIRYNGPYTSTADELIEYLSGFNKVEIGAMEMMQVANTLATCFLYREDSVSYQRWIGIASELTFENDEYHIYTLGNIFLHYLTLSMFPEAELELAKTLHLIKEGGNIFAFNQIRDDYLYLTNRYGLDISDIIDSNITQFSLQGS